MLPSSIDGNFHNQRLYKDYIKTNQSQIKDCITIFIFGLNKGILLPKGELNLGLPEQRSGNQRLKDIILPEFYSS